jgi:disulfide bond formation protein DsbB
MFLIYAAILFALGALGGLYMAMRSFKGQSIPVPVAVLHGLFGASGLVMLLVGVLAGLGGSTGTIALVILLTAALGGFYLLSFHIRKQKHPRAVIVIHALVAVCGFLTLLTAILQAQAPAA